MKLLPIYQGLKNYQLEKIPVRETEFFVCQEHFLTYDGPS
ncbi:hypothetical protein HDEF_2160 [Candidatus Hamiltonella defensa 5AT (Acyrthosiphon pisum)]|uniref:Uncharacterized protein n=1 Tax=Hamiltonella defensa subsp. Acyrthosiphon pisum (strain 5AT) TaxID=572265 RepID=C4K863_HAMD5|nr:hypothetical protein HDEF_2160 [Candidatus Hamiltonella defensa 5AT (Acyrthosiphon pisum)]